MTGNWPLILGWISGASLSAVNLFLLKRLALLISERPLRRRRLIGLLLAKFGGIYPTIIGLLLSGWISLGAFVASFTLVLGLYAWQMIRPSTELKAGSSLGSHRA